MGKNNRLSRDQKRKAKLKKRAERSQSHELLAFSGSKYKTGEYVPIMLETEVAIYECYVVSDRDLTDDDVEAALKRLAVQLREGPLPPVAEAGVLTVSKGEEVDLVIENIRQHWQILEEQGTLPDPDDLIGILATILNSIRIWRLHSLHSRSYLRYLEGFLKNAGVSVRMTDEDPNARTVPQAD
jgi:hypothetical protein